MSSKPKHTPAPWHHGGDSHNGQGILGREHGFYICLIPDESEPEQIANAALICAAPDLLAALEDLRASVQKWAPQIDQSRARAAIAKAKGRA